MYVANARILVRNSCGKHEYRNDGDPVPEAESWTHLDIWLNAGHIRKSGGESNESNDDPPSEDMKTPPLSPDKKK